MKLIDFMDQDMIFDGVKADDKPTLLASLAERVAERYPDVSPEALRRKLTEREEAGSTGIGRGVAIPHATIEGLPRTVCMLICIPNGMHFDAIDKLPVRLIFLLVSPPGETGLHVKLLARIARLVKREDFLNTVAASCSAEALYKLIAQEDSRHVE